MYRNVLTLAAAGAVSLALMATTPTFAATNGGGSSAGADGCRVGLVRDPATKLCVPCAQGTVYDEQTKKCVDQGASILDDRQRYEQGRSLALAGYYREALDMLEAIADRNDAMILTMIGYSTRKLGNVERGIAIYHQALAIDPNNVNTHEYLGEGYVAAGRIDLAQVELDKLEALCGTNCEQYSDLAKAIAGDSGWE